MRHLTTIRGVPVYVRNHGPGPRIRCLRARRARPRNPIRWEREDETAPQPKSVLVVATYKVKGDEEPIIPAYNVPLPEGVKRNPYSSEWCSGFYVKTFDELYRVIEAIADYVDAVAVVNTVWYAQFEPLSVYPLVERGFVPTTSKFNGYSAEFENATVTVYPSGRIRLTGPLAPDDAIRTTRRLYSYIKELGAFKAGRQLLSSLSEAIRKRKRA